MTPLDFLQPLTEQVKALRQTAQQLKELPIHSLQKTPGPGQWSALQCIEHLNRHGAYYIEAIHQGVSHCQTNHPAQTVRHGWLGKKFTQMLSPTVAKPIQTQSKLNPIDSQPDIAVLDTFIALQDKLLASLQLARTADINRRKVSVEFFKLLKIRISDTYLLVVAHEQRHIQQALRAIGQPSLNSEPPKLMV